MKAASALALVAAMTCWGGANAFIPAEPLPEVGWDGLGHLCETAFTLRVRPGEFVGEDPQLEPSYPPSDTARSEAGWFSISALIIRPTRPTPRSRLRRESDGDLYEISPIDPNAFDKAFLFLPSKSDAPAVEIAFFKAAENPSVADWRKMPQRSFKQADYRDVLSRIAFRRSHPPDCLNPAR